MSDEVQTPTATPAVSSTPPAGEPSAPVGAGNQGLATLAFGVAGVTGCIMLAVTAIATLIGLAIIVFLIWFAWMFLTHPIGY